MDQNLMKKKQQIHSFEKHMLGSGEVRYSSQSVTLNKSLTSFILVRICVTDICSLVEKLRRFQTFSSSVGDLRRDCRDSNFLFDAKLNFGLFLVESCQRKLLKSKKSV